MKKINTTIIFLLTVSYAFSQPLLNSRPLEYNGGFAGIEKESRANFDTYFNGLRYNEYYLSCDKLVPKLGGAIGVSVKHSSSKLPTDSNPNRRKEYFATNSIGITYAPKFIYHEKYAISPFINYKFFNSNWDYSNLSIDSLPFPFSGYFNLHSISTGFLINTENIYVGYSINNRINYNTLYGLYFNILSHSIQFGGSRPARKNANKSRFINGNLNFGNTYYSINNQREFYSELNILKGYKINNFMYGFGLLYQYNFISPNSMRPIILLGYEFKNLTIKNAIYWERYRGLTDQFSLQYNFSKDPNKEKKPKMNGMF